MVTIQDFISELRTGATKSTYRAGIYAFLDWKYGRQRAERKASSEEMQRYEDLAAQYLSEKNNYTEDLRRYATSMQDIPPKTAAIRMTGIKEYLLFNDIEFSEKCIRQIKARMPRGGARTIERDLDHEILQTILAHTDVKARALILTLASSGMRIGECLQLRASDINLDTLPAEIVIRQEITKTRQKRITFLSREAVAALREWLKVRPAYLESAQNRNAGFVAQGIGSVKSKNDPRLFPFAGHVAQAMWRTALKNAGLSSVDESTGRQQLHYHQLRKFFRSQMALSCPVDIVEALMGHEGYLTSAYRRYTKEQMAEHYMKSEGMITLQLPSKEITRVETEIKKEMQDQQSVIARLVVQNEELGSELKALKKIIAFAEEKKI
jgi:integrase